MTNTVNMETVTGTFKRIAHVNAGALDYVRGISRPFAPALEKLITETRKLPKHRLMTDESQLSFFQLLLKALGVKKYLEVGVFTGVSALAAALALPPDGVVLGMDKDEETLNVGKPFWKEAGVDHKIEIRLGDATETLDALIQEGQSNSFDFAFIDAEKVEYDGYYERCVQLVKPNGIIAVDNVLWYGTVYTEGFENLPSTAAVMKFNQKLREDDRVEMCMLTVGDGVTLLLKK